MPQTTKTYWRIPGRDRHSDRVRLFGVATGVDAPTVAWPYPRDRPQRRLSRLRLFTALSCCRSRSMRPAAPMRTLDCQSRSASAPTCAFPRMAKFTLPSRFGKPDRRPGPAARPGGGTVPIAWDQPGAPVGAVVRQVRRASLWPISIPPSSRTRSLPTSAIRRCSSGRRKKARMDTVWTLKLLGGADRRACGAARFN